MTETSFELPFVVKSSFSSGVKASCQTRCPTSRYFSTSIGLARRRPRRGWRARARRRRVLPSARDADADRLDRLGRHAGDLERDRLDDLARRGIDDAHRAADLGADTQSCLPSAVNSAKRGRASTSTLSTTL